MYIVSCIQNLRTNKVKGLTLLGNVNSPMFYHEPLWTKTETIRTEDIPKLVIIGDYWDEHSLATSLTNNYRMHRKICKASFILLKLEKNNPSLFHEIV